MFFVVPLSSAQRFTHWYRLMVVRSEWSHRTWVSLLLLVSIRGVVLRPGRQRSRIPAHCRIQRHGVRSCHRVAVHCVQPGRCAVADVHPIQVPLQFGQLSVSMPRHRDIGQQHYRYHKGHQCTTIYARSLQHLARSRR